MSHKILVTASYDETLRFWNYETGICCRKINFGQPNSEYLNNHSHINRLEITPDKRYLAAAGNPFIHLYGLNTRHDKPLMNFKGHADNVTALGFQHDGNWMYSGSEDGTVKIWDMRARQPMREFVSGAPINSVVLHPNEREVICADQNGGIRVWDLTADSCSCELIPEVGIAMRSVAVTWDGQLVVGASDTGTCYIWSLHSIPNAASSYEPLQKLQAHDRYILKCLFCPASAENQRCLATVSSDCTAKIWNVDGFKLEETLKGHTRWVQDCAFTNDGTHLITASSDSTAIRWARTTACTWTPSKLYQGHKGPVNCCALYET